MNLMQKEKIIELKLNVIGVIINLEQDHLYTKEDAIKKLREVLSILDDEDKHIKYT
ncbi:hypothetical protein [Bacillus weihaiensis]|uniref:hypothetical protein n=1 Tax=Bacillus weihaiensis TaxID=1547283 RepID=UPI001314DC9B|nr:hypothetical protein [Bacillus weihaiensis]